MGPLRQCSRSTCQRRAVATLTYVYADSTAVVGPLATYAEPHTYDLCSPHAEGLTVPRGWEILRLALPDAAPDHHPDDLVALVEAVREAAAEPEPTTPGRRDARTPMEVPAGVAGAAPRHLRILREP
ncbi:DUF3499 domain-containing protein [Arthrobacter echini]|uniref:DUF3499 domain-containing protein n=1 Tax=Arthrobacter echini TaxID=1529066 RepID=A0A4S5E8C5_9MICC|nr:DUF3499 domain-containing protein [Arthrobacter echini]THJ67878.1 DUF3499 domain-containing protein [Arthrobacter echini]